MNFTTQNDANGSPWIQFTFQMDTQDAHDTSFCLTTFKNYLTIQVDTLQRIHH